MTRPDPLLEALAQRLREEDELADPRWEALPSGSLSAGEEAELAARGPSEAYEAFRPIHGEELEAVADNAFAEIARRNALKPKEIATSTPDRIPAVEARPAAVIPLAGRRRALYALTATAALAAAASFALLYRPAPAPIASYVAFVEEGNREQRAYVGPGSAPSSAPVRLEGDTRVHVTLRPETAVQGALTVRSFLVTDGDVRAWNVPIEVGPNGTLRVTGLNRATFSAAADGAYDLIFVIGRADAVPPDATLRAQIASHEHVAANPGMQIVALPLHLGPS